MQPINFTNIALVYGPLGVFALWVIIKFFPMCQQGLDRFLASMDRIQDKYLAEIEKNRTHCDAHNEKVDALVTEIRALKDKKG